MKLLPIKPDLVGEIFHDIWEDMGF
jgi:hypothetical protein